MNPKFLDELCWAIIATILVGCGICKGIELLTF